MTNLPEDFIPPTREMLGDTLWESFLQGMASPPPVSIRLHPVKAFGLHVLPSLLESSVSWCRHAFYLRHRPNFTFDPLRHAGVYYVQDAASMFLDEVLRQHVHQPVAMLDLCAAPGGKSTLALSALPEGSLLVSNEPVRPRAQILLENMQKWGMAGSMVTNNYPKDFLKARLLFDVILCDVPCSGEGMFRKDKGAAGEWSLRRVEECCHLQRDIVETAWQCLKPGGKMIYSTCTLNTHENEENILGMMEHLDAKVLPVTTDDSWHITSSLLRGFNAPVYRFLPGVSQGEGLFMCVLQKPGEEEVMDTRMEKIRKTAVASLNILWDGLPPHPISKGHSLIPSHAMALYSGCDLSDYPYAELSPSQAISYLHRETLVLPPETPRGIVLVTFQGHPLGFVKNIGTRANNLYPDHWKIKTTYITGYETVLEPA